jgi:glycosyltransferase involved in cell wall biosynthesis
MVQNRDIIILSLQPWDIEIGSNCKNIAMEFAKHNRVLYVNAPLDRLTAIRQRQKPQVKKRLDIIKGRGEDLVQLSDNLWNLYPRALLESISQLSYNGLFDFFNRINNKRFAKQILSAANRLKFSNYILFNDSDMFRGFYMKELLKPELYIYYTRDNLLAVDFWKKQGTRIEPALMKKVDLVVSNSLYLNELSKRYNKNSFYVGQGCDVSMYNKQVIGKIPGDIAQIPKPIIGYTGALYSLRLSLDIIRFIAHQRPDWNIVLVGPEDEAFRNSDLHTLKNVYFLGNKAPEELPAYVNIFDVAINPQLLNEVTRGNYPRKIDEYLALGKPVVATETEAMAAFDTYVYMARTREDYVQLIDTALAENTVEKEQYRTLFALTHTWENNVKEIYKAMGQIQSNSF